MDIKEKIRNLPSSAGVYIMKGAGGEVLYVGKADSLKKRVSSYFRRSSRHSERISSLVSRVEDVTFIPASTGAEALIYEDSLIKQLKPRYNVALRDDKTYPFLKLTVNEEFPRLIVTRRKENDGSLYFGPYTTVKLIRQAVSFLKGIFPLRTCARMPARAWLNYHIKQCPAPCIGRIDKAAYMDTVQQLKLFLEGRQGELRRHLSEKMASAAEREDFEEASRIKDVLEAIAAIRENTIAYNPSGEVEELKGILGIKGRIERIEAFDISNIMGSSAVGAMACFHKGRPSKSGYRKFRIKTVSRIDDYAMMKEIVGRRYRRLVEEKGDLPDLIVIDGGKGHLSAASEELEKLGLKGLPIIGIAKPAHRTLSSLNHPGQEGGEHEHIYVKGRPEPITLPRDSKALHLLERARDEAHRFAIAYHKSLLSKGVKSSELDDIPGIGAKRRKSLLKHFGSVGRIRAANKEELLEAEGIDGKTAKNIIDHFKR